MDLYLSSPLSFLEYHCRRAEYLWLYVIAYHKKKLIGSQKVDSDNKINYFEWF